MSSTLYWKPVSKDANSLPDSLKSIISKRYGSGKHILNSLDVVYINGLVDGGVKGASELIAAIEKHGEIEVWESY